MNRISYEEDIYYTRVVDRKLHPRHVKPQKPLKLKSNDKFRDLFYEYLKPDIIISRFLGFILIKRENGIYQMKYFSFATLYFIILYSFMSYIWVRLSHYLVKEIQKEKNKKLYMYAIFLFLHLLPIIMVAESMKINKFFKEWQKYQNDFIKITGNPLLIDFKRWRIMFLLLPVIVLTIMLSLLMHRFSEETIVIIIYFSYYILAITILSSIWYKSIHFLCKTSDVIKNEVRKIILNRSDLSVTDLEPLWVNLSRLAKSTGWDFSFTLSYFLLFLFLEVIVATYESLIHLNLSMTLDDLLLIPLALFLILYLASIPFTAQMATSKIGEDFYKFLVDLKIKEISKEKHKSDIDFLLQTILDNSPDIDLGGFVILDNGLITSLMSTMVTYLIVLLQFKV